MRWLLNCWLFVMKQNMVVTNCEEILGLNALKIYSFNIIDFSFLHRAFPTLESAQLKNVQISVVS